MFRRLGKWRNLIGLLVVVVGLILLFSDQDYRKDDPKNFWSPQGDFDISDDIDTESPDDYNESSFGLGTRQHILLVTRNKYPVNTKGRNEEGNLRLLTRILDALRFKYTLYSVTNLRMAAFPALLDKNNDNRGRFSLVIFDSNTAYLNLKEKYRSILDDYIDRFTLGQIFIADRPADQLIVKQQVQSDSDKLTPEQVLADLATETAYSRSPSLSVFQAADDSDADVPSQISSITVSPTILHARQILKNGTRIDGFIRGSGPNARPDQFEIIDITKQPLRITTTGPDWEDLLIPIPKSETTADQGAIAVFNRITRQGVLARSLNHWPAKVAFIDLITAFSTYKVSLDRIIQLDIDDGFVGAEGTRNTPDDIKALVDFQKRWRENGIKGFQIFVGYSGKFFKRSANWREKEGDDEWLRQAHHFKWFDHMWSHMTAHRFNSTKYLCEYMQQNVDFGKRHGLDTSHGYSVAPHHAGVYPIYEPLYECWKKLYNVSVTSTEEYPHLKAADGSMSIRRDGFIHKGIHVLPRQTCGVYTKTFVYDTFPGGPGQFEHMIHGGQVFQSVLLNRFNIFMTHIQNYGNDRLALRMFGTLFNYLYAHTNLKLRQLKPRELAKKYFQMYPAEREPMWTNPCDDKRHLEIITTNTENRAEVFDAGLVETQKQPLPTCVYMPDIVILGPQKTGTTAMTFFLEMHPDFIGNRQLPDTYEEIQFFDRDERYAKGWEWYNQWFRPTGSQDHVGAFSAGSGVKLPPGEKRFIFEKSATYFTAGTKAAARVKQMLPLAVTVALIYDPADRAYSWYNHQRAHQNTAALEHTFDQVLQHDRNAPKAADSKMHAALTSLQSRCLDPGLYSKHMRDWSKNTLLLVDGEKLRTHPDEVLNLFVRQIGLLFKQKSHSRTRHSLPSLPLHTFNFTDHIEFDKRKGFFCKKRGARGDRRCLGSGKGRKYSEMSEWARDHLDTYYKVSNKELYDYMTYNKYRMPAWLDKLFG